MQKAIRDLLKVTTISCEVKIIAQKKIKKRDCLKKSLPSLYCKIFEDLFPTASLMSCGWIKPFRETCLGTSLFALIKDRCHFKIWKSCCRIRSFYMKPPPQKQLKIRIMMIIHIIHQQPPPKHPWASTSLIPITSNVSLRFPLLYYGIFIKPEWVFVTLLHEIGILNNNPRYFETGIITMKSIPPDRLISLLSMSSYLTPLIHKNDLFS